MKQKEKVDNSFRHRRKCKILACLDKLDNEKSREEVLLDIILQLADNLHELQKSYVELLNAKSALCVHVPF